MVIDIANVRDVRAEGANHLPQPIARITGIDGVRSQFGPRDDSAARFFEVDVRDEVLIVWGPFAAGILHRKQRDFVALGPQQVHEFEQVNFRTTKGIVVFIAE